VKSIVKEENKEVTKNFSADKDDLRNCLPREKWKNYYFLCVGILGRIMGEKIDSWN
jgi:hypothetical protein